MSAIVQKYPRENLTPEEIQRVTEINFNNILNHLADSFGSPQILGQFLVSLASFLAIPPDQLQMLANLSFKDNTLPVKNKELIEIYYRSNFSRRDIQKMLQVGDRRITNVVADEKSYIQEPKFNQTQMMIILRFIRFFTEASEQVI